MLDNHDLDSRSVCDICEHWIEEGQMFEEHKDYGLCHSDCVDMAENGPGDEPWEPSPRDEYGRRS